MPLPRITALLLLSTCMLLCLGCFGPLYVYVNFKNAIDSPIWVTSAKTGVEAKITPDHAKRFPHNAGSIIMRDESKQIFEYEHIDVGLVGSQYYYTSSSLISFKESITLNLVIERDKRLYVLKRNETKPSDLHQPKDYPKIPIAAFGY